MGFLESYSTGSLLQPQQPIQQPMWQRILSGVSSGLEPLAYLQQVGFGSVYGLATGDWSRLGTTLSQTAAYAPFFSRPDMMSGETLLRDAFGVKNDAGAKWGGMALDFFADPLLVGGALRGAATIAVKVGDNATASVLRQVASKADYLTSLQAPVNALGRGLVIADDMFGRKVSSLLGRAVGVDEGEGLAKVAEKMTEKVLDLNLPAFDIGGFTTKRNVADNYAKMPGLGTYTVGEFLGSGNPNLRKALPSISDALTLGHNQRNRVGDEFLRALKTSDSIVSEAVGGNGAAYKQVLSVVTDHLDNLGGLDAKAGADVLSGLSAKVPPLDLVQNVSTALKTAKQRQDFIKRIESTASAFGLDSSKLLQAADDTAATFYTTILRAGFNASDYDKFWNVAAEVGKDFGWSAGETRAKLIQRYGLGDTRGINIPAYQIPATTPGWQSPRSPGFEAPSAARSTPFTRNVPLPERFMLGHDPNTRVIAQIQEAIRNPPSPNEAIALVQDIKDGGMLTFAIGEMQKRYEMSMAATGRVAPSEANFLSRLYAARGDLKTADYIEQSRLGLPPRTNTAVDQAYRGQADRLTEIGNGDEVVFTPSPKLETRDVKVVTTDDEFMAKLDAELAKNPDFSTIPGGAKTWLNGMFQGYTRRVMGAYTNPGELAKLVSRGDIVTYKEVRPDEFGKAFESAFGGKVGQAVQSYLGAMPGRTVYASDLLDVAKANGAKLDIERARDLLKTIDPNYQVVDQTMELLYKAQGKEAFGQGKQFSLNKKAFTPRENLYAENLADLQARFPNKPPDELQDLAKEQTDKELAALIELTDAPTRIASLGLEIGKSIQGKTVFETMYKELESMGMLKTADQMVGKFNNTASARVVDGVHYMQVPGNPETYGALADKWVPAMVFREMVQIAGSKSSETAGLLQRFSGRVRAAYLSPLPSVVRNGIGNLALLHLAGVGPTSVLKYGKQAMQMLRDYTEKGYHPDLDGVEGVVNFLHDSGQVRDLSDTITDRLLDAARYAKGNGENVIQKLAERLNQGLGLEKLAQTPVGAAIVGEGFKAPTKSPILGGFLGWFQGVEDWSRMVAYLAARDQHIANGVAKESASQLAARFANNVTFDYSNAPKIVEGLKNTGLVLFPAFPYYMSGRVLKGMYTNPAPLAIQEKLVSATNSALMGQEEQTNAEKMLLGYWAMKNRPILIPTGKAGEYFALPTNYLFPASTFNPRSLTDAVDGAVAGGVFRPVVDLIWAIRGMNQVQGQPTPQTAQFRGGQPIFLPDDSAVRKIGGSLQFLAQSYAPGTLGRTVLPLLDRLNQAGFSKDGIAYMESLQQRYLNLSPVQMAGRFAGINSYQVGQNTVQQQASLNDRTARNELAALKREFEPRIALAVQQGLPNAQALINEYNARAATIQQKYQGASQQNYEGLLNLIQQKYLEPTQQSPQRGYGSGGGFLNMPQSP